jgi:hypothetical protein
MIKEKVLDYTDVYSELHRIRQCGIEKLKNTLDKFSKVVPESKIQIHNGDDKSLSFHIFDYHVHVQFIVNVSNDIGCIQWFYITFNPEIQKQEGTLIIEYYFSRTGSIFQNHSDRGNPIHNLTVDSVWKFFYKNILEFCEKVDAETYAKFQCE